MARYAPACCTLVREGAEPRATATSIAERPKAVYLLNVATPALPILHRSKLIAASFETTIRSATAPLGMPWSLLARLGDSCADPHPSASHNRMTMGTYGLDSWD